MRERLQKILSSHGIASRRAAEVMIQQGRVCVNGQTARLGDSADAQSDRITVDGNPLPQSAQTVCILLNKPRGYVTTLSDELGRKTVAELVDCGCRVYPVGRLDYASEGLLLLTNDGALANRLMHPRSEIEKIYEVTVRGAEAHTESLLARPIQLDGVRIRMPTVRKLRESGEKCTYEITIHEGKNRQIRRMCEAAGVSVARLCRIGEGSLRLGTLPVGKWRYLTETELHALYREAGI